MRQSLALLVLMPAAIAARQLRGSVVEQKLLPDSTDYHTDARGAITYRYATDRLFTSDLQVSF